MDITIDKEEQQPDLFRTRYTGTVSYAEKVTPSRQDVIRAFAQKVKAKPELVVIRKIQPDFGHPSSPLLAFIYESREKLEVVETKRMSEKNTLKAEEKKEEPAEEKPAEAPSAPPQAESPKEDAKPAQGEQKPAEAKEEAPAQEKKE